MVEVYIFWISAETGCTAATATSALYLYLICGAETKVPHQIRQQLQMKLKKNDSSRIVAVSLVQRIRTVLRDEWPTLLLISCTLAMSLTVRPRFSVFLTIFCRAPTPARKFLVFSLITFRVGLSALFQFGEQFHQHFVGRAAISGALGRAAQCFFLFAVRALFSLRFLLSTRD